MKNITYKKQILDIILASKPGSIFVPSDFRNIADGEAIKKILLRLNNEGTIRRIIRGIYEYPEYSTFLKEYVTPSPNNIAEALARNFGWTIIPSKNTALNLLGLSTQVPSIWSYVSDGPYKQYDIGNIKITFKHTTNKDITGMSPKSALTIQAFKALGKGNTEEAVSRLSSTLTVKEKNLLLSEAKYVTAWIYDDIKTICKGDSNNA